MVAKECEAPHWPGRRVMGKQAVEPAPLEPIAQAPPAAEAALTPVVEYIGKEVDVPVVHGPLLHAQPVTVVTFAPVFDCSDKLADVPVARVRQVPQAHIVENTNEKSQGAARGGQDRSACQDRTIPSFAQDDDAPHAPPVFRARGTHRCEAQGINNEADAPVEQVSKSYTL